MANTKKSADEGHIIDVKRPGKSAPSSTSKPVIVTNRPILKDPMVVTASDEGESKPAENLMRKTAPELKPLDLPVETTPEAQPTVTETPAPEAPEEKPVSEEKPQAEKPPEEKSPEEKPVEEFTAPAPGEIEAQNTEEDKPADGKDEGTANPDALAQAEAEKKAAHEQEVQKLVDAKQYFLPINSVEKRKSRHFMIAGIVLSLLLAAAWTDIAMDAGLVTIPGVKPLTHFFSN